MNGFIGVIVGAGIVAASTSRKGREFVASMLSMAEEGIREKIRTKPEAKTKKEEPHDTD